MEIIEVIKKGFRTATKVIILVLVLFALNVVCTFANMPFTILGVGVPVTPAATVLAIIFLLIRIFILGGTLGAIKDFVKEGILKLKEFAKCGLKFYLRLMGLFLIYKFLILIVVMITRLIITITASFENTVITVIGIVGLSIVVGIGIYFIMLLIMSPYVLVVEDVKIIDSIKKSISFVRNNLGRVIGLLVFFGLINLGINLIMNFFKSFITFTISLNVSRIIVGIVKSAFNAYLDVATLATFISFYLARVSAPMDEL